MTPSTAAAAGSLADLPTAALVALAVLAAVQLTLDAIALVRLFRTPPDRLALGSRWPWLAIILLVNLIGAIVFLAAGRLPAPVVEPDPRGAPEPAAAAATRTVAAALYPGEPPAYGPMAAVEVEGLTKRYPEHLALDGLDLLVPQGSVFGFLGRNGAGKTTTLRILLGLAHPTGGRARILGEDVTHAGDALRAQLGFVADVPGYYPWMDARETLRFCGRLFGLTPALLDERVETLLDLAGLAGVTQRVGGYSRGMRQRLGIAQALVNAPRVLLLDEPTSALDPLGRNDVLDMIASLRGRTTVLFSTHILGDVERVCDTVAVVDAGRTLAQSTVEELRDRYAGHRGLRVEVTARTPDLGAALAAEPWAGEVREESVEGRPALFVTTGDPGQAALRLPRLVTELGVGLTRVEPVEPSLEDVFVRLVDGARA